VLLVPGPTQKKLFEKPVHFTSQYENNFFLFVLVSVKTELNLSLWIFLTAKFF